MKTKIINELPEPELINVDKPNLPTETDEVVPRLIEELNNLPNVMFWAVKNDYKFEPFKSSHIMGIKPIKRNIKKTYGKSSYTPLEVVNEEIISQLIIIDYIPMAGDGIKVKEANYHTYMLNNQDFIIKKQRCAMLGIIYIGDYRLARIYEKIKELS